MEQPVGIAGPSLQGVAERVAKVQKGAVARDDLGPVIFVPLLSGLVD